MKTIYLFPVLLLISFISFGQQLDSTIAAEQSTIKNRKVYKMKYGIDIPIAVAGTAWTLYSFTKIYGGDKTPEAEIVALNPDDLNSIDRSTANNNSEKAKAASDKFFYCSMSAPLFLLFDKKIRKDAGKVGLLYLEAMAITGTIYTSSSMIARRFRPYTYNANVEMARRRGGGGRNSFPAGHPAVVATSIFFMAKVYSDYHPEMKNKWILYTVAGGASLATGLLRIQAGQHFPTDVMVGIPVGILSGILVPHFHKNRENRNLTILPYTLGESNGLTAMIKL
ncbi:MAG: phosphatase PAP2 family protein [Rhizobacter sp.]|nr:phosphatase PAP2 family protein [Ferruginibacter sp.]